MLKFLCLCAAAAIVAACTGVSLTKVEDENCECLICEACDSLSSQRAMTKEYELWYDSLTVLVYEHLYNGGQYYVDGPTRDLIQNKKFMKVMDNGFDGLCGIEDTTGCISYFYGAYNYCK